MKNIITSIREWLSGKMARRLEKRLAAGIEMKQAKAAPKDRYFHAVWHTLDGSHAGSVAICAKSKIHARELFYGFTGLRPHEITLLSIQDHTDTAEAICRTKIIGNGQEVWAHDLIQ